MYRVFQKGTGWLVEIKNSMTPQGIINIIPISSPRKPSETFQYDDECEKPVEFDLLTAVTGGLYRYANSTNFTGHWVTNIFCSSPTEARERLNLPTPNLADTKARVRVEATTVVLSYIPGTEDVQMFVYDRSKIIYIGSTATQATW